MIACWRLAGVAYEQCARDVAFDATLRSGQHEYLLELKGEGRRCSYSDVQRKGYDLVCVELLHVMTTFMRASAMPD
jgi:hypothetical protein